MIGIEREVRWVPCPKEFSVRQQRQTREQVSTIQPGKGSSRTKVQHRGIINSGLGSREGHGGLASASGAPSFRPAAAGPVTKRRTRGKAERQAGPRLWRPFRVTLKHFHSLQWTLRGIKNWNSPSNFVGLVYGSKTKLRLCLIPSLNSLFYFILVQLLCLEISISW